MPTRMRLQRMGKKGRPFYHIVIADGRAPRDGKYIERLGTYNPLSNPAEININFDLTLNWLQKGAEPSETVRAILSYKGVLYKHHLLKGVTKGALTLEQAEAKFQDWLSEKESKINQKKRNLETADKEDLKKRLEAENLINEKKAEAIAKKLAKAAAKEAAASENAEESTDETTPEEVKDATEEPVSEEPVAEEPVSEEPVAEEPVAEEPVAEEPVAEEPVAEEPKAEEETKTEEETAPDAEEAKNPE